MKRSGSFIKPNDAGDSSARSSEQRSLPRQRLASENRFPRPPGRTVGRQVPGLLGRDRRRSRPRGFVYEVVILCGNAEIAGHPRCYGEGGFMADPLHYLALLETKPGALDEAAALQGWELPKVF